jgi:hypothetical protein
MTKQGRVQVKPLGPIGPRSSAINWVPPEPTMSEHGALERLKVGLSLYALAVID